MTDILSGDAQTQLRTIIDRIDRLEDDKAVITGDIKEVYSEAGGNGFDVPTLRRLVRVMRQDRAKRLEAEALLDLYLAAVGGL